MLEGQFADNTLDAETEASRLNSRLHVPATRLLGQIKDSTVWAKQLEIKLTAANLGQAEYYLDRLKARVDYLEARAATEAGISRRELEILLKQHRVTLVTTAPLARPLAEVI